MFCPNCGNYESNEMRYCALCGTLLTAQQNQQPQPPQYQQPQYQQPQQPQYQQPQYQQPQPPQYQQPQYQPYPPQYQYATQNVQKSDSLVFGILSIIFGFLVFTAVLGTVFGIIGSVKATKDNRISMKNSVGGLVTSLVGLIYSVLMLAIFFVAMVS